MGEGGWLDRMSWIIIVIESRRKEGRRESAIERRDGRGRLVGSNVVDHNRDRRSREGRSMGEHDWEARWERAVGWIECRGS